MASLLLWMAQLILRLDKYLSIFDGNDVAHVELSHVLLCSISNTHHGIRALYKSAAIKLHYIDIIVWCYINLKINRLKCVTRHTEIWMPSKWMWTAVPMVFGCVPIVCNITTINKWYSHLPQLNSIIISLFWRSWMTPHQFLWVCNIIVLLQSLSLSVFGTEKIVYIHPRIKWLTHHVWSRCIKYVGWTS